MECCMEVSIIQVWKLCVSHSVIFNCQELIHMTSTKWKVSEWSSTTLKLGKERNSLANNKQVFVSKYVIIHWSLVMNFIVFPSSLTISSKIQHLHQFFPHQKYELWSNITASKSKVSLLRYLYFTWKIFWVIFDTKKLYGYQHFSRSH